MSRTSSLGQWTGLPVLGDAADITAVGTTMADNIEKQVTLRYATAVARDAAVTSPVAGMRAYLTTPQVETWYDGTAWRGEWVTSFVPQIDQGATTNITKTIVQVEYRYDGPMIDFTWNVTVTGAGTVASNFTITLPVPCVSGTGGRTIGSAIVFDQSAALRYIVVAEIASASVINFPTDQAAGGGAWGINPSIALANGDISRGSVRYRWV